MSRRLPAGLGGMDSQLVDDLLALLLWPVKVVFVILFGCVLWTAGLAIVLLTAWIGERPYWSNVRSRLWHATEFSLGWMFEGSTGS